MNRSEALEFLVRVAEGIATMFGSACETLVHDMSIPNHPILAIFNGHVSNREVGSTVDIFGSDIDTDSTIYHIGEDLVNYLVVTPSGQHIKSSTFIMDGDDYRLALGINFDITALVVSNRVISDFINVGAKLENAISEVREKHLNEIFDECVATISKPVERLSRNERLTLISMLNQKNAFSFQRSIPFVADKLKISRFTVYKYLKEISGNDGK